jgi:AAHS family 4-hydroxybenzoate transporter-like MFS transporter
MSRAQPGSSPAMDVRTFIDSQPISAYQWAVTAMCGLIVFVDGFDAQAMGFVAPAVTADLHVTRAALGTAISSGLVGMLVGALLLGPLADRIGRRPVLIASTLLLVRLVLMLRARLSLKHLRMRTALPLAIVATAAMCLVLAPVLLARWWTAPARLQSFRLAHGDRSDAGEQQDYRECYQL